MATVGVKGLTDSSWACDFIWRT